MRRPSRPVFLNLFKIRFPVTAVMSMGHRVSGVLLFLCLPLLLYGLQLSLSSEVEYAQLTTWLQQPWLKLLLLPVLWALIHHLFAGIRFLLADLDIAMSRGAARATAWLVQGMVLVCLVVLAVLLL